MKKITFLLILWIMAVTSFAGIRITASAPSSVMVGEQFRIEYTVNSDRVSNFSNPSFGGLEVLYGPAQSVQSSYQYINGHASHSSSTTLTFLVVAEKSGTYTVSGGVVTAAGGRARANTLRIHVGKGSGRATSSGQGRRMSSSVPVLSETAHISGRDLFIAATASKTIVHEQEALLLTYKVYARMNVNLTQLDLKIPDLKGFHTQEIPLPQTKSWKMETKGGRTYKTILWSQYVLFPQQSGNLTIPSISADGIIRLPNQNIDPLDAFFNTGAAYREIKKTLVTPSIKVKVIPLPTRPANFSGAVGNFRITADVNRTSIPANEALNLKVTVSGMGNVKLMKNPDIKFPKEFETYDPKVTDKDQVTSGGVSGTRVFNYTVIPRLQGDFTIPSIEFCYFDLSSETYKTIKTAAFKIHVTKGKKGSGSVDDFDGADDENTDIYNVDSGVAVKSGDPADFYGSVGYYFWYVLPLVLFIALSVYYREKIAEYSNVNLMRNKRANKQAVRRLAKASQLMSAGKSEDFYTEVASALWGYISDKLSIPVAELNHENVLNKLRNVHISEESSRRFLSVLEECEYARFAPGNKNETMDKLFKDATEVIMLMEEAFKMKK